MSYVGVVGIVANPSSARDIRRLVANGALVTTNDKVSMVKRALAGLGSVGVSRAMSMTDLGGISARLADLANGPEAKAWPTLDFVDQNLTQSSTDTTTAVEAMVAAGVGAIIVLGGDGTNGVVADACGDVPIASISTGTNNAFPHSAEPTVVGIAAGLVATGAVDADDVACRTKTLTVCSGERRRRGWSMSRSRPTTALRRARFGTPRPSARSSCASPSHIASACRRSEPTSGRSDERTRTVSTSVSVSRPWRQFASRWVPDSWPTLIWPRSGNSHLA